MGSKCCRQLDEKSIAEQMRKKDYLHVHALEIFSGCA